MNTAHTPQLPLGRIFGFLTKQYVGYLAKRLENTPVQRHYFPLYLIGKNSGSISQQQLADQTFTDKVSMVRILDNLTEEGFIERKVNPDDRRQHLLYVTEEGKRWVGEIEAGFRETDELFLGFLPKEQSVVLIEQLHKLIEVTKDLPVEQLELFYKRIKDKHL